MLTPDLVDALQAPISEASPCGDDLEYDPAFTAAESAARGKPEQQFGDTVIPAVDPDWHQVGEQATDLLRRSKDVRPAVLLLRTSTRRQGVAGFGLGMQLLTGLLERHWDGIHPQLDADDDNDPTMRLNALAPLSDESLVPRDLYDALIGNSRSVGPLRVRDVAVARNALAPVGDAGYSPTQVQGALEEILADHPDTAASLRAVAPAVMGLQNLLVERSGRSDAVDFSRLRGIGQVLQQAVQAATGTADPQADDAGAGAAAAGGAGQGIAPPMRGDIATRQDALQMLDRVIDYLRRTEPGNPAPLLIERAKKLIGVSFLDIIANLAPDAMNTIEHVTGARAVSESD
ncbi:MAG: type VI secretion system protein TssA [Rhodocyclaceae bacterium]|nr:type VI secretion system protein TssA [Pseudomonadota bacterium]MDQ7973302.1 type VI secretion system protein TssA [Rhodocyclaceae bacterium]MDQ8000700.1 type VI secretion system protein TssA [Pseudomonadota bacterium]MDQ8019207.1 type VI secretion system protein TssA [Pseudomonadota bacterium]